MNEKKPDIKKHSKSIEDISEILILQRNTPRCNSIYELKHEIIGMINTDYVKKTEAIRNILIEIQSTIDEMTTEEARIYLLSLQVIVNTLLIS
jgi:hypothetical protein